MVNVDVPGVAGFRDASRGTLIRRAFRLEWFTVAWMTVEAVVAITSGIAASSISLTAFGIDSLIELASAGVLMWRLSVELNHGRAFSEAAERIASRIADWPGDTSGPIPRPRISWAKSGAHGIQNAALIRFQQSQQPPWASAIIGARSQGTGCACGVVSATSGFRAEPRVSVLTGPLPGGRD